MRYILPNRPKGVIRIFICFILGTRLKLFILVFQLLDSRVLFTNL